MQIAIVANMLTAFDIFDYTNAVRFLTISDLCSFSIVGEGRGVVQGKNTIVGMLRRARS